MKHWRRKVCCPAKNALPYAKRGIKSDSRSEIPFLRQNAHCAPCRRKGAAAARIPVSSLMTPKVSVINTKQVAQSVPRLDKKPKRT